MSHTTRSCGSSRIASLAVGGWAGRGGAFWGCRADCCGVRLGVWGRFGGRGHVLRPNAGVLGCFAGRLTPGVGVVGRRGGRRWRRGSAGWGWERLQALERGGELPCPAPVAGEPQDRLAG